MNVYVLCTSFCCHSLKIAPVLRFSAAKKTHTQKSWSYQTKLLARNMFWIVYNIISDDITRIEWVHYPKIKLVAPSHMHFFLYCFFVVVIFSIGLDQALMGQMGPISPPDLKPDTSLLNGNSMGGFSPGPGSPGSFSQMGMPATTTTSPTSGSIAAQNNRSPYPPNHPLSGSKHLCSICGDRASGKHYGVYRYV